MEEIGGPLPVDATFVKAEVKLPEPQTGDDRRFVPVGALPQDRSLAAGSSRVQTR